MQQEQVVQDKEYKVLLEDLVQQLEVLVEELLILEVDQEVQEVVQVVQESLLSEPQVQRILAAGPRHKYSNYITSPSRRLQSSYIYSIRNINNINNLCTFFLIKIIL
jgi:hypothetical protein